MLLVATLLLLGLESASLPERSAASVINDCWKGHAHSGMSACVEGRAREARASLNQAEKAAKDSILASVDEPGFPEYRKNLLAKLSLSSSAFSKYLASECGYEASLAAKGNGSEDVRLACVAMLSEERAQLIRETHPVPQI
ncbi:lysozyme inhibitor LprI family protein [Dyella sp. 2RAF44]|uniref:lysozyme inhibitor LprI family protein n=1 Tax=Dyella sp. 2RAF44 TaxID=3233000 RepID=UPI003F906517